jgi:endogenous inhibitor of DNA gyrase (YacG/DUF329 family)
MARKLKCPQCKGDSIIDAPFFPFCCERCQLLDLGAWAEEKYRVASNEPALEVEEEGSGEHE